MTVSIKTIHLSYNEEKAIRQSLSKVTFPESEKDLLNNMKNYASCLLESLDDRHLRQITDFSKKSDEVALIVRGLPMETCPPQTPEDGKCSINSIPFASALNFGMYALLDICPVTYLGENDGHLIRHVVPTKNGINQKSSYGSESLGMHVDDCHLPLTPELEETSSHKLSPCPEYLSLYGIRCDAKVFTKISLLSRALDFLDEDTIEQLEQPNFILTTPDSFGEKRQFEYPVIIRKDKETVFSRFDKEFTIPKTLKAQRALDTLNTHLLDSRVVNHLLLLPGDFLIFKNQRVTHAREKFTPRFDGTDRWMIRLFGLNSLEKTLPVNANNPYYLVA